MKCFVGIFLSLVLMVLAVESLPSEIIRRASDLYFKRSGEAPTPPKFNIKLMGTTSGRYDPDFIPYQKYVACVSRSFKFEKCTLCYCTDLPNIALCWDYEGEQCLMTQRLVDEQKHAKNNDPTGIW